jgi:phage recombination protein Bet
MSQAVSIRNSTQLAFTTEDLQILKNTKFKNFTNDEVAYCAKICGQLNLSPFLNQIHFVKRKNKDGSYSISSQVGIDGFRLHAQRSGGYAGSDEPVYEYDEKSEGKKYPAKATVTVYKIIQGVRCPYTASARWDEFYPGDGPNSHMWQKMPHNQLAKCAEALALRKACPAELSGLYTDDEMHQADKTLGVFPEQPAPEDGHQTQSYCVPYGAMAKKPIEECDPAQLRDYVLEIEEKAKRLKKPVPAWAQEMIKHAEPLIAAWERQNSEPGWEG